MMAKAKLVFARRNTLGLSSPQPAFLLGVPPPNARISGIETEGQPSMGEPSSFHLVAGQTKVSQPSQLAPNTFVLMSCQTGGSDRS